MASRLLVQPVLDLSCILPSGAPKMHFQPAAPFLDATKVNDTIDIYIT